MNINGVSHNNIDNINTSVVDSQIRTHSQTTLCMLTAVLRRKNLKYLQCASRNVVKMGLVASIIL